MPGLSWQKVFMPLSKGMNTRSDKFSLQVPELAVCRDAQFDRINGMQTRRPFRQMGSDAVSDVRRITAFGDELLLFTKDTLYTWSVRDDGWREKGAYLAPKIEEQIVFQRTADQSCCDRAELSGCVFFAWQDATETTDVYLAALDEASGAVLLAPTLIASGANRPRLVTMTSSVVLFFVDDATPALKALSLDPDHLDTSIAATPTVILTGATFNYYYDVAFDGTNALIASRHNATTSYYVSKVTEALAATTVLKARTAEGPVAVSVAPNGYLQIVRTSGVSVVGDLLNGTSLADVYTNQAIGSGETDSIIGLIPFKQIAAAHNSVLESGQYRCHIWWSYGEYDDETTWESRHNWADTGNTIGSAPGPGTFIKRASLASRPFAHDGHVYLWLVFAGVSTAGLPGPTGWAGTLEGFRNSAQNIYLLYRDDGVLVVKASDGASGAAGAGGFAAVIGHLPGVQSTATNVYAWAGVNRRVVGNSAAPSVHDLEFVHGAHSYEARTPCDIRLTMDSDDARRAIAFGETLYVSGGMMTQYDGLALSEVGFLVFPNFVGLNHNSIGGKARAPYSYKSTFSWRNAKGEIDRSSTNTIVQIDYGATGSTDISAMPCYITSKEANGTAIAVELWATLANPIEESLFYLATDIDPSTAAAINDFLPNNRFLLNDSSQDFLFMNDADNDSVIATRQENLEQGNALPNAAPPGTSIVYATQDRLFYAGIPGRPDSVGYSQLRTAGFVASFSAGLMVEVPRPGGDIAAVAVLDENLVVFRETAIYVLAGQGFSNTGEGDNFGPPRRISGDVGAISQDAIAVTPGGIIFKSKKGWHLLPPGQEPQYIGAAVAAFDGDTVKSIVVIEAQQQIRCLTDQRMLVFDYFAGQWSEWTIPNGLSAVIWKGQHVYLASDGIVRAEAADYTGTNYGLDVESTWIPTDSVLQGFGLLRNLTILGEYRSDCRLRVRVAYNKQESDGGGPVWVDDRVIAQSPAIVGGPLQLLHGPSLKKCESFKFRLTAVAPDSLSPPSGEALRLTGITMQVGQKQGIGRQLPAAQRE